MKKVLGLVAALALSASAAFAGVMDDMGIYGKLDLGYARGASYFDTDYGSGFGTISGFELYPALVIVPEATKFEGKPFYLSFEASLDMVFGKSDYYDGFKATVITPGISPLFNWSFEESDSDFLQKLTPYGINIGVPIQKTTFSVPTAETYYEEKNIGYGVTSKVPKSKIVDKDYSSTSIGLGMGFVAGARYALTEKIEVNAETGYNFLKFHDFFLRLGANYRFK